MTTDQKTAESDIIEKTTTPSYRPPEMWELYNEQILGPKCDIWALGCITYRLCYRQHAFGENAKLAVLNGSYSIPNSPQRHPTIKGLIRKMLRVDVSRRLSANEVGPPWRMDQEKQKLEAVTTPKEKKTKRRY